MKYAFMIFVLTINSFSQAMDAPDVTDWKRICEKPEQRRELLSVYKDFCWKRVKKNIPWAVGSSVPLLSRTVRNHPVVFLVGLVAMRQNYLLGRNIFRNGYAQRDDLSYLNTDVLEQLGNPDVHSGSCATCCCNRVVGRKKGLFGNYYKTTQSGFWYLSVDNVGGIERALDGECWASDIDTSWP